MHHIRSLSQTQLLNIYFYDVDGDQYGSEFLPPEEACQPSGVEYVDNALDCNDFDDLINPGASEACDGLDNDCDTVTDEDAGDLYYPDADSDGYGDPADSVQACEQPVDYVLDATDCNDADAAVNPGAAEQCDELDNNCNASIDEGVTTTYSRDADNDGYGTGAQTTQACQRPAGYANNSDDCNDANFAVKPGATEICNGLDDNCSGAIDEGNPGGGQACAAAGQGVCAQGVTFCTGGALQCAPTHAPSAEVCDGRDNDCDGQTDEGVVGNTYYRDFDGDGYGNAAQSTQACSAPAGYVANSTDCNDNESRVKPGAAEVCDGLDNNCNGSNDEGVSASSWYRDE